MIHEYNRTNGENRKNTRRIIKIISNNTKLSLVTNKKNGVYFIQPCSNYTSNFYYTWVFLPRLLGYINHFKLKLVYMILFIGIFVSNKT